MNSAVLSMAIKFSFVKLSMSGLRCLKMTTSVHLGHPATAGGMKKDPGTEKTTISAEEVSGKLMMSAVVTDTTSDFPPASDWLFSFRHEGFLQMTLQALCGARAADFVFHIHYLSRLITL